MQGIPQDIKAEILISYLSPYNRSIELKGAHKRNAYEDIANVSENEDGSFSISISRNGIYDILPEALFHPIDRFDNIPANEYKERFKEECDLQQIEEDSARSFFRPFDNVLMELSTIVSESKYAEINSRILESIICDSLPDKYMNNRFVEKAVDYLPICRNVRGNKSLMSFMIRRILFDENICIHEISQQHSIIDSLPRYNPGIDYGTYSDDDSFLGNEFDEDVTTYHIQYWNEDECDERFLTFVEEMKIFEDFLNEYFMGIESNLKFNISTKALPVRLSDEVFYTFLDYNTNL